MQQPRNNTVLAHTALIHDNAVNISYDYLFEKKEEAAFAISASMNCHISVF